MVTSVKVLLSYALPGAVLVTDFIVRQSTVISEGNVVVVCYLEGCLLSLVPRHG